MSLVDPRAGRAFIWIVTAFLFFSIITGGGCLLMYMILPETETTAWLPIAGLSLVCLPWFFWFLTFFYRVLSRACGFRVSFGTGATAGGGRGGGGGSVGGFGGGAAGNAVANASAESPQGDARGEENENGHGSDQKRRSSSSSSSAGSRESEMPFAISMGS